MKTTSYIFGKIFQCMISCEKHYNAIKGNQNKRSIIFQLQQQYVNRPIETYKMIIERYNHVFSHPKVSGSFSMRKINESMQEIMEMTRDKPCKLDFWEFLCGTVDMNREFDDYFNSIKKDSDSDEKEESDER